MPQRLNADQNLFNALSGFAVAADEIPHDEGYAAVGRVSEVLAQYRLGDDEQRLRNELREA